MLRQCYLLGDAVVGTVGKCGRDRWEAHGCVIAWKDVDLGQWLSPDDARARVEHWVEEVIS
jgi:hypothetical protein